jgi:hypothetical protein
VHHHMVPGMRVAHVGVVVVSSHIVMATMVAC